MVVPFEGFAPSWDRSYFMDTKTCIKCNVEKSVDSFYKKEICKNCNICIDCHNIIRREKYAKNRDKILVIRREKDRNNPKVKEYNTWYRNVNREILNKKSNEYQKKPEIKHRRNENLKKRRESDVRFRIEKRLRGRVYEALREQYGDKSYKTMELLGCSIDECCKWLESKFLPGMTWENYGQYGWHIDHIVPCAIFDLTKPEEQLKCFHYTNLQPLWWEDNLSKGSKLPLDLYNSIITI